jgi:hypothetical protein
VKLPPRDPNFELDLREVEAAEFYVHRVRQGFNDDANRELELMAFMATIEGRPIDRRQASQMLGTGIFREQPKKKRKRGAK